MISVPPVDTQFKGPHCVCSGGLGFLVGFGIIPFSPRWIFFYDQKLTRCKNSRSSRFSFLKDFNFFLMILYPSVLHFFEQILFPT